MRASTSLAAKPLVWLSSITLIIAIFGSMILYQAFETEIHIQAGISSCENHHYQDCFSVLSTYSESDHLNDEGHYYLGLMHYTGDAGKEHINHEKAYKHFAASAKYGHVKAQYFLGYLSFLGLGLKSPDYQEAAKWLSNAALQDHTHAQYLLGYMYYNGLVQKKVNYKEAKDWFTVASNKGHRRANFYLGEMHLRGNGVPKNMLKAVDFYMKSADQGFKLAQRVLDKLNNKAKGNSLDNEEVIIFDDEDFTYLQK